MNQPEGTVAKKAIVKERIDELLSRFNRSDEPGLVVGVVAQGKTIYRRGFGLASVEQGVANQPFTRFRIGSTSKHFACLAVMLLVEEGKLDIDASVRRIVPELPPEVGEPTLRQFMTHTSGLRDFLDLSFLTDGVGVKPQGYALKQQLRLSGRNDAPGQMVNYNNGGYQLLSLVIDRVAGMPMEQFVRQRIFEPMAMSNTSWAGSDLDVVPGLAALHVPRGDGGWRKGLFPYEDMRAEGGMVSTVDDLLRWLAHLRCDAKVVGSTQSWRQMIAPAALVSGEKVPYAFGLFSQSYRGLPVIHHGGGVLGGACQMITVPTHALDIVILTNGALVNPSDLAESIIDVVLEDEALEARVAPAMAAPYRALVGKSYRSATSDLVVRFDEMAGTVLASVFNTPLPLVPLDGDLIVPFEKIVAGPLVFRMAGLPRLAEEAPNEIVLDEGSLSWTLSLVTASTLTAPEEIVGHYAIPELGSDAEVSVVDGKLQLLVQGRYGHGAYFLHAVDRDAFLCDYAVAFPLRGTLTVERSGDNVTGLSYSSLRTRGLKFVRR